MANRKYPIDNELLEKHLNIFLDEWQVEIDKKGLTDASLDEKDKVRPTKSRSYARIGLIFQKLVEMTLNSDKFRGFAEDTKEMCRDESLYDCIRSIRRWDRKKKAVSYFAVIARTACTRTLSRYHYTKRLDTVEFNDEVMGDKRYDPYEE